jgi:hypothetical protein
MLDTALLLPRNDTSQDSAAALSVPWWPALDDEPFGPLDQQHSPRVSLALADDRQTDWCQRLVTAQHYLRAPVDPRCSVLAYLVLLAGRRVGCLIFGRPEATGVGDWYGSPEDKIAGRCRLSRWEVLNLARLYIRPELQDGGPWCRSGIVPGFIDRHGCWRSSLATTVIGMAIQCVVSDYLLCYSPVFLDQPYQLVDLLSYCDPKQGHQGAVYRHAGFRLERTNSDGLQSFAHELRPLTPGEDAYVRYCATHALRSKRYRSQLASSRLVRQVALF